MIDDLKLIKKHYGEDMMHLCRELFPTILETPGLLYAIIDSHFHRSRLLYDDVVFNKESFREYINYLVGVEFEYVVTNKNPFELMQEAGYTLYECKTEEEIQYFKKYYEPGEVLCTFNTGRLDSCYVFFAVKNNVQEIKRENFKKPERQDEYGTSVISIQFSKGINNFLSIKNRYNMKVDNPDTTFSNNLENIISGLSYSFIRTYGFNFFNSPHNYYFLNNFIKANDGKYYKYNYKINGIYYCSDNIIIDNNFNVITAFQEKEKYLVIDFFVIDLVNKKVYLFDNNLEYNLDEFIDIEKIVIIRDKEKDNKIITFILKNGSKIIITIDKFNKIISSINSRLCNIREHILEQEKLSHEFPEFEEETMDSDWITFSKTWK